MIIVYKVCGRRKKISSNKIINKILTPRFFLIYHIKEKSWVPKKLSQHFVRYKNCEESEQNAEKALQNNYLLLAPFLIIK